MQCYAGFENGRLILTKAFAESLTRAGFPPKPEIVARARAMDSAAAIVDDDERGDAELTAALNRAYERMLRGGNAASGPDIDETFAGVNGLSSDFEGRAKATRGRGTFEGFISADPASEARLFTEFKQARGWDRSADDVMRINFALENSYAEQLRGAN